VHPDSNMYDRVHVLKLVTVVVFMGLVSSMHVAARAEERLADPTKPIGYRVSEVKKNRIQLQAVFYGENRKEAILNGVLVNEGDTFQGNKIIRIHKASVVYQVDSETREVHLRPSIFKK